MLDGVRGDVTVEGCTVRYHRVGARGEAPLLMVHGGGGHAGWWTDVVPRLAERFDMIVPDLSGHGDSEHRRAYGPTLWMGELAAILETEAVGPVRLVGHSMGGLIGTFMAVDRMDLIESLIFVDPGLRWPDEVRGSVPRGRGWHPTSVYRTPEEALAKFRLPPGGTTAASELVQRVGRQGLRQVPTGWTWKFDPRVSRRFTDAMVHAVLPLVKRPVGIIRGEMSLVASVDTVSYVESRVGRRVPSIMIPDAHHHVPLDQPAACAEAIARMVDTLILRSAI